jgi:hypothetical protein
MPKPCYLWDEGYRLRFLADVPDPAPASWAGLATRLVEGLFDVVEPLALGAEFRCYDLTEFPAETGSVPPVSFATVYTDSLPSYVTLPEYSAVDQASPVGAVSPDVVEGWLAGGLDQRCGEQTRSGLRRLEMSSARSRLLSPYDGETFSILSYPGGPEVASVPVEDGPDGRWLYAPVHGAVIDPPVTYRMTTEYGEPTAVVAVHWSWWFEPGSAELGALRESLHRLVAAGWRYVAPDDAAAPDVYSLSNG